MASRKLDAERVRNYLSRLRVKTDSPTKSPQHGGDMIESEFQSLVLKIEQRY